MAILIYNLSRTIYDPVIHLLGINPKELKSGSQKINLHSHVHWSIVQKAKKSVNINGKYLMNG